MTFTVDVSQMFTGCQTAKAVRVMKNAGLATNLNPAFV
jgi:hypothetical protein